MRFSALSFSRKSSVADVPLIGLESMKFSSLLRNSSGEAEAISKPGREIYDANGAGFSALIR